MPQFTHGRLDPPGVAPERGEKATELVRLRNLVIEQILSGPLEASTSYLQEQDEWVAVLDGAARVEVDGESLDLHSGDWVLIPAATPHRLLWTQAGTRWLTVHLFPEASG